MLGITFMWNIKRKVDFIETVGGFQRLGDGESGERQVKRQKFPVTSFEDLMYSMVTTVNTVPHTQNLLTVNLKHSYYTS